MEQRLLDIVETVRQHEGISPDALAGLLGVSTRTVRTYVQRANREMAGTAEIYHLRGDGYRLRILDSGSFDAALSDSEALHRQSLPDSRKERIAYLLNDLLSRSDWITLDMLAETLYTSRRTISEDLKPVEETLSRFGLAIERRPHYGMRVAGSEMGRRLCMAHLATMRSGVFGAAVDSQMLAAVSACIDDVTSSEGFSINRVAYQNLIVHIAVAVVRIKEGAYVPMAYSQLQEISSTQVFQVARHIALNIEQTFSVKLPDEEVAYITLHLSGRQLVHGDGEGEEVVISDEVWSVVVEIIDAVEKVFHFDFRDDLELKMNLARHIVPLEVRLKYHMHLENPLLADITTRFPLAWSMANEASAVLARRYHAVPSDDETGYLALAFALALERQKEGCVKKSILVVCASGAGSAKLLEHQYRREFGAYLDRIETCDVGHIDAVDFSQIDYVFTTVPLPHSVPAPVRRVRFFLDTAEIGDVRRILSEDGRDTDDIVTGFFSEELFCPHLHCDSREEVIALLCERLREFADAPESLEHLVWERESLAPSSFGGGIAMPHPIEPVMERTYVAVGLLDEAIMWESRSVQIVFLVSISIHKGRNLDGLYEALVRFMNDGRLGASLLANQTFATLCTLLGKGI